MTLPLEHDPSTNAQNPISMSQVNVELFFGPTVPVSLNDIKVRNLFQKPDGNTIISLRDGFGKSNVGKPKNPVFTNITQTTATVSWGASDGVCNKYTITVKDAATDTIIYGPVQEFTTLPLALTANLTGLVATTHFTVHLLAANTAVTPLPTAETTIDLLTLENVPLTPAAPTVTVISKNILRVTGSATYATSYDIYEVISGTDTVVVTGVQVPYDHTVGTYTLHTYKIKGRSTGVVGAVVAPISPAAAPVRSLPDFPVPATNLNYGVIANITSTSIAVNWTLSTSPVIINERVRVLLRSNQTVSDNSGLLAPAVISYTTTSALSPATQYDVYVDTINEAGTATSTVLLFTTKTAQPVAPAASATSQTSITVTWGVTTGAVSYVIYKDNVSLGTKTSPFIDNTGVTSYTLHSYQVAAVNDGGESVKSTATSERSFPDMPVAVTNLVVTPDMNSFALSWTASATTSTRTVDGYRVYVYLTSDMSVKYDSGATLITGTSKTTDLVLLGWTGYTIRVYTFNRAGSVYLETTSTTLPDTRPDPTSDALTTVTNIEPSATNVQSTQVTIGTLQPNYNTPGISITTSTGSFQAGTTTLTTGWVTSATVVPDGSGNIVFQARMNASSSETTTVTSTFSIGSGTRTFSVRTRDPNPPTGLSATGGTGTATISWTNLGYTYIVTADTGQTKTVSNVGSVVLGDSPSTRLSGTRTFYVYARNALGGQSAASSTSATVTPMPTITLTVNADQVTETTPRQAIFYLYGVNVPDNTTYSWSMSGIQVADIQSLTVSDVNGTISGTPALTGSVTIYNNFGYVLFILATDYLMEGDETVTFTITGSPVLDFSPASKSIVIKDTSLSRTTYYKTYWTKQTSVGGWVSAPKNTNTSYIATIRHSAAKTTEFDRVTQFWDWHLTHTTENVMKSRLTGVTHQTTEVVGYSTEWTYSYNGMTNIGFQTTYTIYTTYNEIAYHKSTSYTDITYTVWTEWGWADKFTHVITSTASVWYSQVPAVKQTQTSTSWYSSAAWNTMYSALTDRNTSWNTT